jgi:hypothetical protein
VSDGGPSVASINRALGLALLDDGRTVPFVGYHDADYSSHTDFTDAQFTTIEVDGKWSVVWFHEFEEARVQ